MQIKRNNKKSNKNHSWTAPKSHLGSESVISLTGSHTNGESVGRASNRFGWLHTFLSCIRTLITLMKLPPASVSLWKNKNRLCSKACGEKILK